ncbi:Zn-ribbon domain-containing OB-fold protein [Microbacterium sp. A196]
MDLIVESNDSERQGYFEHAKAGRLVVQSCDDCSLLRGAIGSGCPFCASPNWSWREVSGRGQIYSWQMVMHAIQPQFRDWVPYPIVLVELDEQRNVPWRDGREGEAVSVRLITNLVAEDVMQPERREGEIRIGRRVEVCFADIDETRALPQFRLIDDEELG